jgi:hypothetical protein
MPSRHPLSDSCAIPLRPIRRHIARPLEGKLRVRSGVANIWVRSADGELVRADALIGLQCREGSVEASRADGRCIRLTESGCPPDFHVQLLDEIAKVNTDDRWIVIISPLVTADSARWTQETTDELIRSAVDIRQP